MRKKILIALTFLAALSVYLLLRDGGPAMEVIEASRGSVIAEVFETGVAKKGENIPLGFKNGGRIESFYLSEGDRVEKGGVIASVEDVDIGFQFEKALAALEIAEIEHSKLLHGATEEDLRIVRSVFKSAEESLLSAEESFEKAKELAETGLTNAYRGYFSAINDSYLKSSAAHIAVRAIYQKYFAAFHTKKTADASWVKEAIREKYEEIKEIRDSFRENLTYEEMDSMLALVEGNMKTISRELDSLIGIMEDLTSVTDEDIDAIISQKNSINQGVGSLTSLAGSISLAKSTKDAEISAAETRLISSQGAYDKALGELEKIESRARPEDVSLSLARIRQAQAEASYLRNYLNETKLRAPLDGRILRINSKIGEIVQPGEPVAILIPEDEYQIESNIYEGDISKIKLGNRVKIELVALPNILLYGKVVFIEPGARVIDGVVYYKTLVSIDEAPDGILPGMTADITVQSEEKEGVLVLPEAAISRSRDYSFVNVLNEEGAIEERRVEIGLRGADGITEIVSGISEGDKVVLP